MKQLLSPLKLQTIVERQENQQEDDCATEYEQEPKKGALESDR